MDIVQSSNRVINSFPPLNNITPFTRVDGWSFLEVLEGLRRYVVEILVGEIDDRNKLITDQMNAWFEQYKQDHFELIKDIQDSKDAWQVLFDDFMADVVAQLEALNDLAAANLVNNETSKLKIALNKHFVKRSEYWVDPRDFGAKGDGVTDDLQAFRDCSEYARGTFGQGMEIRVTPGDYYVSHVVDIYSNQHWLGIGQPILRKRLGASATMFFGIRSFGKIGYGSGATNFSISNFKVMGDFSVNRAAGLLGANHASHGKINNIVFEQASGNGHLVDLGGCDDIEFNNIEIYGGNYQSTAARYNECIQIDNSTRRGSSYLDEPFSYDGLPSKNITLNNILCTDLTVNGINYPAPMLVGSHAGVADYYHENITLNHVKIINPWEDYTNAYRGVIHFVSTRGIFLNDVEVINSKGVAVPAFRIFGLTSAISADQADSENPTSSTLPAIQTCSHIRMNKIRLKGFKNITNAIPIMSFRGNNADSYVRDIHLIDVRISDSEIAYDANGASQLEFAYAENIKIERSGSTGGYRFAYFATVGFITFENIDLQRMGNGFALNGTNVTAVKVRGGSMYDIRGALYLSNSSIIGVEGVTTIGERGNAGTATYDFANCRRHNVHNNVGFALSTASPNNFVRINGVDSGLGNVRDNISAGYLSCVSVASGLPIVNENNREESTV